MEKIKTIKGTHDILGKESEIHDFIIKFSEDICRAFNFQKISTPIIEDSMVFQRTLGDSTDIISKEMYSFVDSGGDKITLRPEGTAPITRCMISNSLFEELNQKFYYFGPMFRRERPQSGRLRQFHQFGVEIFNDFSFFSDAEIILVAYKIIKILGLEEKLNLEINSLGNKKSRNDYKSALLNYFSKYKSDLSEESKFRLEKNVLRILDSKNESDKKIIKSCPRIGGYLDKESRYFFEGLKQILIDLKIPYNENFRLVRGLDYYDHTIFEFIGDTESRQSAVFAGGRYDNLSKTLGGRDIPGVGWAAGIERISLILNEEKTLFNKKIMVIFASNDRDNHNILKILNNITDLKNITFHTLYNGSFKKKITKAHKLGAISAIILGEEELLEGNFSYKDLRSGKQDLVKIEKIKDFLIEKLNHD